MRTRSVWSRTAVLAFGFAVVLLGVGGPADAAQNPPGCTANTVVLDLQKGVAGDVAPGTVVTFSVRVANPNNGSSCNAINVTANAFCPDASW